MTDHKAGKDLFPNTVSVLLVLKSQTTSSTSSCMSLSFTGNAATTAKSGIRQQVLATAFHFTKQNEPAVLMVDFTE